MAHTHSMLCLFIQADHMEDITMHTFLMEKIGSNLMIQKLLRCLVTKLDNTDRTIKHQVAPMHTYFSIAMSKLLKISENCKFPLNYYKKSKFRIKNLKNENR